MAGCLYKPQLYGPQHATVPSSQPRASPCSVGWIPFISPLAPMGNQVETTKMRSSFQIIKYTSTLLSQVSLGINFIVDFHWDLDS